MEFSISQVLETFNDDKLVAPKLIEKKIGITTESQAQQLQIALDALAKIGILAKDKGRYRRAETEQLVEGRLRCSSKGFCFAIQETEGAEDIYIRENDLSNAWNGDRVLVKVTKNGVRRRSPEGEVRLITERANPTLLAKVKSESENGVRAVPLDDRLLFEIELVPDEKHQDLKLAVDKLIHLEMVRYPLANQLPKARIVKILGDDPESTADIDLVCCKYNLPREFSAELLAESAAIAQPADLPRRDLRDLEVVVIGEHPGISLTALERGWRLGVHILDMASYVAVDSLLDQAAKQRLRSFFLGDSITIPLFPRLPILEQSEICTISVVMELDQAGDLTGFEIFPALVKVARRLSYVEAETAAQQDLNLGKLLGGISTLTAQLQQQRQGIGAIALAQLPWVECDEGLVGVPVFLKSRVWQGQLCELAILANRAIATHIVALGLPGIFRTQSPPDILQLQEWGKLVGSMGIELGWNDPDKVQPQELQQALNLIDGLSDPYRIDILKHLLYELLLPGEYSEVKGSHFGLGMVDRAYVHGVSPQHRYADLLTQRLLHLLFQEGRDRRSSRSKEGVDLCSSKSHGQVSWSVLPPDPERHIRAEIEQVCNKLNQQDLIFRKALTDLDGLRKAEVMSSKVGESFYGIITSVQSYGFFVQIEGLMAEGLVHVSSLKDDWYEFPQANHKSKGKSLQPTLLVGRRSGRQYCLGDRILVEVKSVDYYRQQIDLVAAVSTVSDPEFVPSTSESPMLEPESDQLSDQLAERFTQKTWGKSLDLLPEHEQAGE